MTTTVIVKDTTAASKVLAAAPLVAPLIFDTNCTNPYSTVKQFTFGNQGGAKMSNPKVYSTAEAADYLGMPLHTVNYYIHRRELLKPDLQLGREYGFYQSTLDAFKTAVEGPGEQLTMAEAAEYLGVSLSRIRNHVVNTKRLVADGKRGRQATFSKELLDASRDFLTTRAKPGPSAKTD